MPWLSVCVTFAAGRYHGEEWPPSPLRLYQALLAGVMTGTNRRQWAALEEPFRWLERQAPPKITAAEAKKASCYRLSVPNNDFDVAAREWTKGRTYDVSKLKTMKNVAPREVEENGPHLRYLWPVADSDVDQAEALRSAVHCLHTLGWGVDMAFADGSVESSEPSPADGMSSWTASRRSGQALAIPVPGSLDDLRETYARYLKRASGKGVDTDTRPSVYGLQAYVKEGQQERAYSEFGLRTPDGRETLAIPWYDCMAVAAWVRHAAGTAMKDEANDPEWVDRFVFGHQEQDPSDRLSFAPLPSVGHQHSDGKIRRMLIVEPRKSSGETVELLRIKLATRVLTAEGNGKVCQLAPMTDRHTVWPFYLRRSRLWQTVTPMVLHGFNCNRGQVSLTKTDKLIEQAFESAGYPPGLIEDYSIQPAPFWPGSEGARRIRVPHHLSKWPRYHVAVKFKEPVNGPVLAGIGRHYGIGVFAAPGDPG